jgi:hypothetical protein
MEAIARNTIPPRGNSGTVTVVTVNVAGAAFDDASVARTVLAPVVDAGTVNVTPLGIAPDTVVVTVAGLVVTVVPSYFIVTVEDAANPEPDTVTVVLTGSAGGFSVMDGAAGFVTVVEDANETAPVSAINLPSTAKIVPVVPPVSEIES